MRMRRAITVLVLMCAACGPEREEDAADPRGEAEGAAPPIVLQASAAPEFDAKLAAIHEEWMGTAWTFTGTSQTPGEGSIACGYFVTTTLQQAGVEVERVRLAQAASETMILATTAPESVRRYSDASLEAFLGGVRKQGAGYYIVGLDNHTGFLKVEVDGTVVFIHSGPGRGVVKERPEEAPELSGSRYRVTGKLPKE